MSDDPRQYLPRLEPTPDRPLQGLTVLVIEDSRFASEAIRLLCLRSGARLRRADSIAAAHRHLAVYRPSVVIADMGLPDGSGADIIAELAQAMPQRPILIGMSGDPGADATALAAGADSFLSKPVENLALFQQMILRQLPDAAALRGPRALPGDTITPDPLALEDDLEHAAELIAAGAPGAQDYIAQFLGTVARSAHDSDLETAASGVADAEGDMYRLAGLVKDRLALLRAS